MPRASEYSNPQFPCEDLEGRQCPHLDQEEDKISLLPGTSREHQIFVAATRRWNGTTWLLLAILSVSVLLLFKDISVYAFATGKTSQQAPRVSPQGNVAEVETVSAGNDLLHRLGWVGTLEYFRQKLIVVSDQMEKENKQAKKQRTLSQVMDISPLYDLIDLALDAIGVRGVFFELFENVDGWYIEEDENCIQGKGQHGTGCGPQDSWWLWHYTGAIAAEKFLTDGSLRLDGVSEDRLESATAVVKEIHHMQELRYTGEMSFHGEHGFIWHYLTVVEPDLTAYPVEMADAFCGGYLINNVRSEAAHKNIGSECYHGFGHGLFSVLAVQQIDGQDKYTARRQFRPQGGFQLNDESMCKVFEICETSPHDMARSYCYGGIKHSTQLLNKKWTYKPVRDAFFEAHRKLCAPHVIWPDK
jgi:hypothetical protein